MKKEQSPGRARSAEPSVRKLFRGFDGRFSHMPFAAWNPEGGITQLCCIPVNGLWKLHHFNGNTWERVPTGFPADATECAPTAESEDGILKISFIAGGREGDRRFRLYRKYGLDGVPVVQTFADVGFCRKNTVVFAGRRGPVVIRQPGQTVTLTLPDAEFLYRVSYDPFRPDRLLISGQRFDGSLFSWRCLPGDGLLEELADGGVPAYKCAFWGSDCYYAERLDGFEDRRIVRAEHLTVTPLDAGTHIRERVDSGYSALSSGEFV